MSNFTPRLTTPSPSEKWWNYDFAQGALLIGNSSESWTYNCVLPNCVGYAWGRFAEIMGGYPTHLATGNAGDWYDETTVYQKTQDPYQPRLGAVIVWKPNHVGIVEEIERDSSGKIISIVTSESGWSSNVDWSNRFWTTRRYPPNYDEGRYTFVGFIYNPAVSDNATSVIDISSPEHPARKFVAEAEKHVGAGGHAWVQSMTNIGNQAWCAATCCAVAKACGYAGKIMPGDDYVAPSFGQQIVEKYGGTRIDGPVRGNRSAIPQTGDLVIYQNYGDPYWEGSHIGIVRYCEGNTVHTVEGNAGNGEYLFKEKDRTGGGIGWYARPDWSKVGGSATVGTGTPTYIRRELYDSSNDSYDASIREVCYMTPDCEPSISLTSVKLSAINYTTMLAAVVKMLGGIIEEVPGSAIAGSPDNIDGLPAIPREIVEFLKGKGLNTAAAIGIIANIRAESSFRTDAVGDYGTSFGLCQWHNTRNTAMRQVAGSNWDTNLTGQLEYLWIELNQSYYIDLLYTLQAVPNTLEGAKQAADAFIRNFEFPDQVDRKSIERQGYAREYWNMVVVVNNGAGPSGAVADAQTTLKKQSGAVAVQGTTVTIPDSVPQTGIIANFTSYTAWFSDWASGTTQRRLADIWASQGKPHSHNIATISGYYLIALKPTFGNVGDLVSVVLKDGTYFNAIIADAKGSDSPSEWGHYFGNQVDIVEWEAYGTSQDALRSGLEEAGWLNKAIGRIINYGSWFN